MRKFTYARLFAGATALALAAAAAAMAQTGLGAPTTVEGAVMKVGWLNPSSEVHLKNAATGEVTIVNMDMAERVVAAGGSPRLFRPGMVVKVEGVAAADGSRVFADLTGFSTNGAALFPDAKAQPGMAQTLALRLSQCGMMPDSVIENAGGFSNEPAVERAVNAWQAGCDAKVEAARAAPAISEGAVIDRSPLTNSVVREAPR